MILSIDTTVSQKTGVFLKSSKGKIVDSLTKERKYGSQTLLPQILAIFRRNKLKLDDLESIEVNPGPGSYTGVRVGVAVANALSWALNLKINNKKKGELVYPIY
jgi:tRNA threonylcarbamoyladenosine biosynthesis protein TsaB